MVPSAVAATVGVVRTTLTSLGPLNRYHGLLGRLSMNVSRYFPLNKGGVLSQGAILLPKHRREPAGNFCSCRY